MGSLRGTRTMVWCQPNVTKTSADIYLTANELSPICNLWMLALLSQYVSSTRLSSIPKLPRRDYQ